MSVVALIGMVIFKALMAFVVVKTAWCMAYVCADIETWLLARTNRYAAGGLTMGFALVVAFAATPHIPYVLLWFWTVW